MDRDPKGREATRDPIFLLQAKRYHIHELPEWAESDGDGGYDVKRPVSADVRRLPFVEMDHETKEWSVVDVKAFVEWLSESEASTGIGYKASKWWDTRSVLLTRDEAEAWAEATSHHYEYGWRVYCIPCDGDLATLLRTAYAVNIERPTMMMDAILAEYRYWRDAGEDDDGLMGMSISAMGACSNLLCVAQGLLDSKYKGDEWVSMAFDLQAREDALYAYLQTTRVNYPHPIDAVAVFLDQITMIVRGFDGVEDSEVESMTGGRITVELLAALKDVAALRGDLLEVDGLSGKMSAERIKDAGEGALTVKLLTAAGWTHGGSSSYLHHPAREGVFAVVWSGGIHLKIGDFSVSQEATIGDLVRLESLIAPIVEREGTAAGD